MGRRNKSARLYRSGQTFSSLEEAKETFIHFDLTKGERLKKRSQGRRNEGKDIFIGIGKNGGDRRYNYSLNISIRKDLLNIFGGYVSPLRVIQSGQERLYLQKSDSFEGYKISVHKGSTTRAYAKCSINEKDIPEYKGYEGDHDIAYDPFNDAYYITKK